jgi:hypothetical protein
MLTSVALDAVTEIESSVWTRLISISETVVPDCMLTAVPGLRRRLRFADVIDVIEVHR